MVLAKNEELAAWCHRHLARGEQAPAVHARVRIELDVLVTTPDLCQQCMEDLDSWLRLFGLRESPDECLED